MRTKLTLMAVILLATMLAVGCTSQSTRLAIDNYESSGQHEQVAVDNALRIANEYLFLATAQYLEENAGDKDKMKAGLQAAFEARETLEVVRVQYERARALNRLTVGQYIYDKQGAINILLESKGKELSNILRAKQDADEAADEVIKHVQPASQPASQPSAADRIRQLQEMIHGK